jgi:Flp pilus assembly protein TadD
MTSQLLNAAMQHYRAGRLNEAIDAWNEIVKEERHNWLAWYYLGLSYRQQGMEEDACRVLALVAALSPDPRLADAAARALPSVNPEDSAA